MNSYLKAFFCGSVLSVKVVRVPSSAVKPGHRMPYSLTRHPMFEISSFDEFLADLIKDDGVLTMEEELTWMLMMKENHEKPESRKESKDVSKEGPKFMLSRGFPIRHLSTKGPVPKITIIEQQIQHDYSPQIYTDINQIPEATLFKELNVSNSYIYAEDKQK